MCVKIISEDTTPTTVKLRAIEPWNKRAFSYSVIYWWENINNFVKSPLRYENNILNEKSTVLLTATEHQCNVSSEVLPLKQRVVEHFGRNTNFTNMFMSESLPLTLKCLFTTLCTHFYTVLHRRLFPLPTPPSPWECSQVEVTPHGDRTGEHGGQELIAATALPSWSYGNTKLELRQYQVGNTSSRKITEVKKLGLGPWSALE